MKIYNITHYKAHPESPHQLLQSRTEEKYKDVCWSRSHRVSRQQGLSPEYTSFLFRLKNDLLVTRERLFRVKKSPDPLCVHCRTEEGHTHILTCEYNSQVTVPLKSLIHQYMPDISLESIVCMDWEIEGTAAELPLLWVTALCLSYVWDKRKLGRPVSVTECNAELIGQWNVARKTKHENAATVFEQMIREFITR